MERIDAAALDAARGKEGLSPSIERYRLFNEILSWHAHGEEIGVFPVLETVAPPGGRGLREGSSRSRRGFS